MDKTYLIHLLVALLILTNFFGFYYCRQQFKSQEKRFMEFLKLMEKENEMLWDYVKAAAKHAGTSDMRNQAKRLLKKRRTS